MMLRFLFTASAVAATLVSLPASAAGARNTRLKITVQSTTSVSAAASAAPAIAALAADADVRRDDQREARHAAMVQKLALQRASKMSAALLASAPRTLPRLPGGLRLGEGDEPGGFAGLSNVDQSSVNYGYSVEPPDQALCAGNGYLFEGVNDAFSVFSEGGKRVAGPAQANAFFRLPFAINVSDPKCLYDAATDRWFVTMIAYDNTLTNTAVMIAVSQSGDPTGSFIVYQLDTSNDGSDFFPGDCPCLGDQPLIGLDANGFYISTNAFGTYSFQGAQVYAISKAALARGDTTVGAVHFDQLSYQLPDVEFSYSIQPAFNPPGAKGEAGTEYLAQSMRALTLENRLAVWAIRDTTALDGDPSTMTMSSVVIPSQTYAQPVPATQKDGPTPLAENDRLIAPEQPIDGNDQRLSQVMYLNGQLWTAVGTAAVSPGTPVRDAIGWFVINVASPGGVLQASVAAQGYIAGPGSSHLVYPAVAVNSHGEAAMVFTLTGTHYYPSAATWSFGSRSIQVLADGAAPQDGFSAYYYNRPRWGDYSAASVGSDGSIWMATEMIPGGPRRRAANWGTFIGRSRHHGEDD